MQDLPKLHINAALCCLKPAPWTTVPGVCIMPKLGHGKRCKFMPVEGLEIDRSGV